MLYSSWCTLVLRQDTKGRNQNVIFISVLSPCGVCTCNDSVCWAVRFYTAGRTTETHAGSSLLQQYAVTICLYAQHMALAYWPRGAGIRRLTGREENKAA
jgi:hypothetical protein